MTMSPNEFFENILEILEYPGDKSEYARKFFLACEEESKISGDLQSVAQKYTNKFISTIEPHLSIEQKKKLAKFINEAPQQGFGA